MIFALAGEPVTDNLFVMLTEQDVKTMRDGRTLFVDQRHLQGKVFRQVIVSLHKTDGAALALLKQGNAVHEFNKIPRAPDAEPRKHETKCKNCLRNAVSCVGPPKRRKAASRRTNHGRLGMKSGKSHVGRTTPARHTEGVRPSGRSSARSGKSGKFPLTRPDAVLYCVHRTRNPRPIKRVQVVREYLVIINGSRFDYLLCSVFADTRAEAMRLARREVEPGEQWKLIVK